MVSNGWDAMVCAGAAQGLTGWEEALIVGGVTSVTTFLFLGGYALFFRYTKAGRRQRRRLGKLIAGPEWGK